MIIDISEITTAKTADEMTSDERTVLATALHMYMQMYSVTATTEATILSFALGTPVNVFIDGQKVDGWNPSNDWDSTTSTISSISHVVGSFIEVNYMAAF